MKIGYCKLGRSIQLRRDKWGVVGGDDEPPILLDTLARRNPTWEFRLVGRNSGEQPVEVGLPPNVTNPWTAIEQVPKGTTEFRLKWYEKHAVPMFQDLDGVIVWLGQHHSASTFIPPADGAWGDPPTKLMDSALHYEAPIIFGLNYWREQNPRRDEVYLIADARNTLKVRDLKWPSVRPFLGQYEFARQNKHERYHDPRHPEAYGFEGVWANEHLWWCPQRYTYSRLEICGILPQYVNCDYSEDFDRRHFGLFINEARAYVKHNRADALRDWVLPLKPAFLHGKWSEESMERLNVHIEPAPASAYYDLLRSVRCTLTTPSSGSGWATTKPWQAFAVGTVCFFHPQYDTQDNILRDLPGDVRAWLRCQTPGDLWARVAQLQHDHDTWLHIIRAQRALYDQAVGELRHAQLIEQHLKEAAQA